MCGWSKRQPTSLWCALRHEDGTWELAWVMADAGRVLKGLKLLLSRLHSLLIMLQKSNYSFPLFEFISKFLYQNVFHFLSHVKTNHVLLKELISSPSQQAGYLLVGTAQAGASSQSMCGGGADRRESNPHPSPAGQEPSGWVGRATAHPLQTLPWKSAALRAASLASKGQRECWKNNTIIKS